MLEDPARHRGVLYFAGLPVRAEPGVSEGLPQAREDILRSGCCLGVPELAAPQREAVVSARWALSAESPALGAEAAGVIDVLVSAALGERSVRWQDGSTNKASNNA